MADLISIGRGKPHVDMPWGGYDFSKDSKAVVAADSNGHGAVLWTVGAHVNMEMQEGGLHALDDLGLEPPEEGIWIWEGRWVYTRDSWTNECDSYPVGAFRRPTVDEWVEIMGSRCPWDDREWLICFCEQGAPCPLHEVDAP